MKNFGDRFRVRAPSGQGWIDLRTLLEEKFVQPMIEIMIIELSDHRYQGLGTVASEAIKSFIADIVSATPGVLSFENRIEVRAPFNPADQEDPLAAAIAARKARSIQQQHLRQQGPGQAQLTDVTRFPSISPINAPTPGELFFMTVDLALEADPETQAEPAHFRDVPSDWVELIVDIEIFSDELDFANASSVGVIKVRRDQKSIPANFAAMVKDGATAAGGVNVRAMFSYQRRHSGTAIRHLTLAKVVNGAAPATDPSSAPGTTSASTHATPPDESKSIASGAVVIAPDAATPALTIKIMRSGVLEEGVFVWSLDAIRGVGGPKRTADLRLGESGQAYAKKLLNICPELRPGQHTGTLRGIGEAIWKKSPEEFRSLYVALRANYGSNFPIQIITDEPYVPWEMMRPDAKSPFPDSDHLLFEHPISRWTVSTENAMPSTLPIGMIATFAPDYGGQETLPAALEESKWLIEELGAKAFDPTYLGFTDFVGPHAPDKQVAILHFAGHGCSEESAKSGLRMTDGWVRLDDMNHSGVVLGNRDHTFVVINACEVGAAAASLCGTDGWPQVLTDQGFGGVLAPLWPVQDDNASMVVRETLEMLVRQRKPLGECVRTARAACRDKSSTPYAYLCYGDVMAKMG